MIFEQIAAGGCQSYLVGCAETCAAALIDPQIGQIDRYLGLARMTVAHPFRHRTRTRRRSFLGDRASSHAAGGADRDARQSPAPFVDHTGRRWRMIVVDSSGLNVLHTPGHTGLNESAREDRVFTGRYPASIEGTGAPTCLAAIPRHCTRVSFIASCAWTRS